MPKRTPLGGIAVDEAEPLSIINIPIDWNKSWNLAKQARSLRFLQDDKGNIIGFPVIQVDPTANVSLLKAGAPTTPIIYNTATLKNEMKRTTTVWTTSYINSVSTADVWTPAATQKYRVLGFSINWSQDYAGTGVGSILLKDSSGQVFIQIITGVVTAGTIPHPIFMALPDNGWLGIANGNKLQATLFATLLTSGGITVNAWGCLE